MGLCEVGKGGSLQEGRQIRESRLRSRRLEIVRDSVIGVPLASVSVHVFLRVPVRAMDVQVSHDDVAMILKTLRFLSRLVH